MPKFQPNITPKHVILHDINQKKHVTFDNSDDEAKPIEKKSLQKQQTESCSKPRLDQLKKKINNKAKTNGTPIISLAKKRKPSVNVVQTPSTSKKGKKRDYLATIEIDRSDIRKSMTKAELEEYEKTRGLNKRDAHRKKMSERRKAKKLSKIVDGVVTHTPLLQLTPEKLTAPITVTDLRNFVLYTLTNTEAPSFARITRKSLVKHTVVLYASGLDITAFGAPLSRDDVPPFIELSKVDSTTAIGKANMPHVSAHMSHMFVFDIASGFDGKFIMPTSELLQCPLSLSRKEKQYVELKKKLEDEKTDRNELFMLSQSELDKRGYPVPTCVDPNAILPEGWKETRPASNPTEKKRLIAVDCEMVLTASGSALARISLVNEEGEMLLDEYVKPDEPIVNYLTEYSGITKQIMDETTCSLRRVQKHVRKLVDHNVILIGHSLDSDLKALKLAHPYCADTAILYDSTRGPPFRPKLRSLTKTYLRRNIQENDLERAGLGHNSVADAKAAMDLFKLKVARGFSFGRFKHTELIFDRFAMSTPPQHGMIMETDVTGNRTFQSTLGSSYERFNSDSELAAQLVKRLSEGEDFILAQVEAIKSYANEDERAPIVVSSKSAHDPTMAKKLATLDETFLKIYDGAPANTVIMLMGGMGDVFNYRRLKRKRARYERYVQKVKNQVEGDTEEIVWTNEDDKQLAEEGRKARLGCALVTLKA